jgi:hypothetical protein
MTKIISTYELDEEQRQERVNQKKTIRDKLGSKPKLSLGLVIGSMISMDLIFLLHLSW